MAASKHTFDTIRNDILQRRFKPVYLFMGDEAYFMDALTELLHETVLTETEKDFNLLTFYGVDSDTNVIISSARRYPMMAEHQLIIVREAQNLDNLELLEHYLKNPMPTTILVINYKHGTVDRRKAWVKQADKTGIVFESKKLYDNQIPSFITAYFKERKIGIDEKSARMLADYVGNDISKLIPQLQKLEVSLPEGFHRVTSELIERNVGISKDYNTFELQNAIIRKDVLTANRIVNYFEKNPKDNPIMATLAVLFNYFSNLLECFWLPRKDEQSIMAALNLRSNYFVRDYVIGLKNYNANKVMEIISDLRTFDARSKGVDNISASQGELLKELVYRILH
ncbi:DNA polymerase III subunit delta [Proteiniphilum sp. UBA1028]|jgi:DNA polymerase-3 subunit delta|uniref:DNA polymerase III subunit delta n=1 Tax=Proteiniphilum sp. UBA1028 TaxID=1947251 RepID=UPI000E8308FE|nr:DNA polymerase III subunit delta [Proteiniphilum sp. UBA1028]HBG59102.1 DNA polymerase III subunit delta [Porphyromonadaceae bacterium]